MALRTAKTSDVHPPEGRPDVRSWPVEGEGGQRLGTVQDVLVDDEGHTRYLDVELADRDDRVLVPVGHARADRDAERIRLPGLGEGSLGKLATWSGRVEDVDPEWERNHARSWDERYGTEGFHHRPDFYGNPPGALDTWDTRGDPTGRLARLDQLDDYEVADHDHDPRGWSVVDGTGRRMGRVDHLVGDTGIMKVRYLVVETDATDDGSPSRHVLVPAGYVALQPEDRQVRIDGVDRAALAGLPAHTGVAPDRETEERITRAWRDALGEEHRYRHPRYRESYFYGTPGGTHG